MPGRDAGGQVGVITMLRLLDSASVRWPDRAGEPLAPDVRSFMEARLDAEFGDVRIHTGPAAAALCDAMGARAFTLGSTIAFADDQYAPDSSDGLLLLAHELVHVLQQRATTRHSPAADIAIGDPRDPCEDEADRLAAEALAGGRRSAVTHDRTGAIRRAIKILDKTAQISASHYQRTTPGISYLQRGPSDFTRYAVLHLTQNAGRRAGSGRAVTAADLRAIRLTGSVLVQAESTDNVAASWDFRLVQLFRDEAETAAYAGRTPADGRKTLNFAGPTYFSGHGKYLQDSDPDAKPLTEFCDTWHGLARLAPLESGMWQASAHIDDHPFKDIPLVVKNDATHQRNYLYHVDRKFDVITALVAREIKTGKNRPLAYIGWGATCTASLHWYVSQGVVMVDPPQFTTASFSVGSAAQGAHPDAALASMIAHPHHDPNSMYNRASDIAFAAVLRSTTNNGDVDISRNWTPRARGAPSVPANHFK